MVFYLIVYEYNNLLIYVIFFFPQIEIFMLIYALSLWVLFDHLPDTRSL